MAASDNRYDFWINLGGANPLGFNTYITKDHPYQRSTADYRKEQINSAAGTGDTALTGWWTEGQLSFHGGGGLRYDTVWDPSTSVRFDVSAAVDAYRSGELRVGYGLTAITGPTGSYNSMSTEDGTGIAVAQGAAGTLDVINASTGTTWTRFPSPGGTALNNPGINGQASAYLYTPTTIERCWPTANRPAIRGWANNPALVGAASALLPGVFNSDYTGPRATGNQGWYAYSEGYTTALTSSGVATSVHADQGFECFFVAPGSTVLYNLSLNPTFASAFGAGQVATGGRASSSSNIGGFLSQNIGYLSGVIGNPNIVNPSSSTMLFASSAGLAASTAYSASTTSTITLPAVADGTTGLAIAVKSIVNDPRLTGTGTITVTPDVGAPSSQTIGTATTPNYWFTTEKAAANFPMPVGATSATVQIVFSGTSGTGTAVTGQGIGLAELLIVPWSASGSDFFLSYNLLDYFDGARPPLGFQGFRVGGVYGTSLVAASSNPTVPVMVTARVDNAGTPKKILGGTYVALDYAATAVGVSGSTTTWAVPCVAVNGVTAVMFPPATGQIATLRLATCTDVLKQAVSDGTTAWSSTGWAWDGATNASTQTFTGANFSEPLACVPSGETFVRVWWAKSRMIALTTAGNWYQYGPSARHITAPGDLFWTVPAEDANSSIPWVVREGPDGIYIAHANRIWVASLDVSGTAAPTVTQVTAVADDEVIQDLSYYLGQLTVCTDHGMRGARLNLYGRLILGPRFMEGNFTNCTPWDDTVLVCGTRTFDGVQVEQGVFAVSMIVDNDQNTTIPAYWNVYSGTPPLAVAASVLRGENDAATGTHLPSWGTPLMLDSAGQLQQLISNASASGVMTSTRLRLGTLESKVFRYLYVRTEGTGGSVAVSVVLPSGNAISLGTVSAGNIGTWDLIAQTGFPLQGAEYVQFQFTLTGPVKLTGWQIKAQPNPQRQRLIKVPLMLMDKETSIFGVTTQASAAKRLLALEALENTNAMVTYVDNTTGDSGNAYIESMNVVRQAPATAQSGSPTFGGVLELTLRKA